MKNYKICNSKTGICGLDDEDDEITLNIETEKVQVYYFTDPICSHCYTLEPVIKKFREVYSDYINFNIVLGGLLENWDDFIKNNNEFNHAKDIYQHWQEVSKNTRMPIDGSIWLKKPIKSSYPASKVYQIIEQDDQLKAEQFLRLSRIYCIAFNKDISNDKTLIEIVNLIGLNGEDIVKGHMNNLGEELLEQDLYTKNRFGIKGFPTTVIVNSLNRGFKIVGSRNFSVYENALNKLYINKDQLIPQIVPLLQRLLEKYIILFFNEIETLYNLNQNEVLNYIKQNLKDNSYIFKKVLNEEYIELNNPHNS